jgi:hypothetical protein
MSFINRYNKASHEYYDSIIVGNFIYAGGQIFNGSTLEGLITKTDNTGRLIWERMYTSADGKGMRIRRVVQCANEDVIVVIVSANFKEYGLMRVNTFGDVVWRKYFVTVVSPIVTHDAKVIRLNEENYVLHIHDTYSSATGGTITRIDNHLIKTDGSGNILIQKTLASVDILQVNTLAWDGTHLAIGGQQYMPGPGVIGTCVLLNANLDQVNKFGLRSLTSVQGHVLIHRFYFRDTQLYIYGSTGIDGNSNTAEFLTIVNAPSTQSGTGILSATTLPISYAYLVNTFSPNGFYYTKSIDNTHTQIVRFDTAFTQLWSKKIELSEVFNIDFANATHVAFHGYFYDRYIGYLNADFESCKTSPYDRLTTNRISLSFFSDFTIGLPLARNTTVNMEVTAQAVESQREELCATPVVIPTFTPIGPVCAGSALSTLPTVSLNGISGTWSPALNNQQTTTYTFTPNPGQNATPVTMTITVNPIIRPTFDQLGPFGPCDNMPALPTVSREGIRGIWSPAFNPKTTTTYFFTPHTGQCATGASMTITIQPNTTLLHEVCWTSLEDYEFNINIPKKDAIEQDALAAVNGLTRLIQPVWRPGTSYYVHFVLKDTVDNGANAQEYPFTYGFSTDGAVGYFHTNPYATYGDIALEQNQKLAKTDGTDYIVPTNGLILDDTTGLIRDAAGTIITGSDNKPIRIYPHPDKYALTGLSRYIDYERSYPNADGNLLASKPLFYNDQRTEINVYFNKAYVTHFFQNWAPYKGMGELKGRLKIVIKDPRESETIVNPPYLDYNPADTIHVDIPQTIEDWRDDDNPQVPFVISQYLNLYNSNNCIVTGGEVIKPKSKFIKIVPKHLKPSKLYTAIVNNVYDVNRDGELKDTPTATEIREVHKFVFQTSRYAHFREQVNSYLLKEGEGASLVTRKAIFKVEKAFTPQQLQSAVNTIKGVADAFGDAIKINYQHAYDRVFEGILGFSPWDNAISTEFNVIRDTTSNAIVAIIIRNPEPFVIPKMPIDDINKTIAVLTNGAADGSYKMLYSKDCSQVILMQDSMAITATSLSFRFQYRIWNGVTYTVPDEPNVPEPQKMYTIYVNDITL